MIDRAPRLLFVPVSGPFGRGEYARSLAIAQGARGRWADASIRFILSRDAPYAAAAPFPATLLPSSPTFHSAQVIAAMEAFRPDVVIFDNAGRTAQLRHAKRMGLRVVYISARRRQRRKAFRLRWMRLIDEHWIAYPEFIAGKLGCVERLKLKLLRRPTVRFLDVIMALGRDARSASILSRIGCRPGPFVLFVPGGGTGHPGVRDAVGKFYDAARRLAAGGGGVVFVGGAEASGACAPGLRTTGSLPQAELIALMRAAHLIVANGGSTLIQAIACGRPCIAVPIAGDQRRRIGRCVAAGVALAAPLDAAAIVSAATWLLDDATLREALAARATALALADGVEVATRAMRALL